MPGGWETALATTSGHSRCAFYFSPHREGLKPGVDVPGPPRQQEPAAKHSQVPAHEGASTQSHDGGGQCGNTPVSHRGRCQVGCGHHTPHCLPSQEHSLGLYGDSAKEQQCDLSKRPEATHMVRALAIITHRGPTSCHIITLGIVQGDLCLPLDVTRTLSFIIRTHTSGSFSS